MYEELNSMHVRFRRFRENKLRRIMEARWSLLSILVFCFLFCFLFLFFCFCFVLFCFASITEKNIEWLEKKNTHQIATFDAAGQCFCVCVCGGGEGWGCVCMCVCFVYNNDIKSNTQSRSNIRFENFETMWCILML